MKKSIFILLMALPWVINAQPLPKNNEGEVYYSKIIAIDSSGKEDLFARSVEWVAKTYNSANHVIQLKDQATGKIIVKGIIATYAEPGAAHFDINLHHMLTIQVKEGKAKIEITDFRVKYRVGGYYVSQVYIPIYDIDQTFEEVDRDVQKKKRAIIKQGWAEFFARSDKSIRATIEDYANFITQKDAAW